MTDAVPDDVPETQEEARVRRNAALVEQGKVINQNCLDLGIKQEDLDLLCGSSNAYAGAGGLP